MSWNEQGDNKDQDPWGGKRKSKDPEKRSDLDKLFAEFQKKMTGSGGGGSPSAGFNILAMALTSIAILFFWFLLGFFVVKPAEKAVILRFGKYTETVNPGLHWIPRLMDVEYKVNEEVVDDYSYAADMLTRDENIVSVAVAVQYRKANAKDFLFNVINPIQSLQQATASSLRQVIGNTTLDEILTSGREEVSRQVNDQLTQLLDSYHTGLEVVDVALQPAKAPEPVKAAFDDAIKAQEDEQRFINQAQAYTKQVVPYSEGQAKRLTADAGAYQQQVILNAKGDVAGYNALLPEYRRAPEVTRERLYIGSIESVLTQSTKILLDTGENHSLLYMPLDKLFGTSGASLTKIETKTMSGPLAPKPALKKSPLPVKSNNSASLDSTYLNLSRKTRDEYMGRGN